MPEIQPYLDILPTLLTVLTIAFIITPLIGTIAQRFGFVDLPQAKRKRTDRSIATRIHTEEKLRIGGLAVLVPFVIVAFSQMQTNPQISGLVWGLTILIIGGVIDDKYELSPSKQMLIQFIAALIAVLSGITITGITLAGTTLDFNLLEQPLNFGLFVYNMVLPADLITIIWILGIVNAINWMSGIDAIGELTVFLAAFSTMLLSVRAGQIEIAILSGALAAGILGFVPFNFPPSKIMSGTAGTTGYGFILAVLAVISGAKITSALMLLSIPVIDMVWVMIYRFVKLKDTPFFKRPFVGGKVHLHHRLMGLGLNQSQALWLEISIISIIAILAFAISGFSDNFVALIGIIALLIVLFTVISIVSKRRKSTESIKKDEPPQPPMITDDPTPEQKYAY